MLHTCSKSEFAEALAPEHFAEFLQSIFESDVFDQKKSATSQPSKFPIPSSTMDEPRSAVRTVESRRCQDVNGTIPQTRVHALDDVLSCVIEIFNGMLNTCHVGKAWKHGISYCP